VIGVILSVALDDGTSGLLLRSNVTEESRCPRPPGGHLPEHAQSAVNNVNVDHVVTLAQIPALIAELSGQRAEKEARIMPPRRRNLPDIAKSGPKNLEVPDPAEPPRPDLSECGGALWEVQGHRASVTAVTWSRIYRRGA